MFHSYVRDVIELFKDETSLLAWSASGEGDAANGLARSSDIFSLVRSIDPRHVFVGEPVGRLTKLPEAQTAGWHQDLLGARTYFIGSERPAEFDFGVEYKLYRLGGLYKAEGEWPESNITCRFHYTLVRDGRGVPQSWAGTPLYRLRLRDALYLALVHQLPLVLQWDEQIGEDEHLVFRKVRDQVDWSQRFMEPKVAIRVDTSNVTEGEGRTKLGRYEESFAHMPLAYQFILPDAPAPATAAAIFDARQPYEEPRFRSQGGSLPDSLAKDIPLHVSSGYCASYLWSEDRRTLLWRNASRGWNNSGKCGVKDILRSDWDLSRAWKRDSCCRNANG